MFFILDGYAQRTLTIHGKIYDSKSHTELAGAVVQLLRKDSTEVGRTTAYHYGYETNNNGDKTREYYNSDYYFEVPHAPAEYLLKVTHVGYSTSYTQLSIGNLKKSTFTKEVPAIYLKSDRKMLKEVSVTASKVKFYHKGDTLVYNADAFVLAEGSMLDALIKQMPGVEIKPDGRIYHNGKFVENLLLNGKDFFKGNQSLMLENLPSYTVKQVKVYEKSSKQSEFLGREVDAPEYVMDVNLKKEYSIGWITNLEAGAGTSDRYMARLFAMRYTDHSRVTLYGNLNNLNDKRRPGQDTNFSPEKMPKGNNQEKKAGLDYEVSSRNKKFELYGNVVASYSNLFSIQNTERINFLNTGNTYGYEYRTGRDKNLELSLYNELTVNPHERWQIYITPSLTYNKVSNSSRYAYGDFKTMQHGMNADLLSHLYTLNGADSIRKSVIAHNINESKGNGHELSGGVKSTTYYKMSDNSSLSLSLAYSGTDTERDLFNKFAIRHGETESQPGSDANQYYRNHPNKDNTYRINAGLNQRLAKDVSLFIPYHVKYSNKRRSSQLYELDKLEGGSGWNLGYLPSAQIYESVMDAGNSYNSRFSETAHGSSPQLVYKKKTDKGRWDVQIRIPVDFLHQQLRYQRGAIDTTIVRNSTKVEAENCWIAWFSNGNVWRFVTQLETRVNTPDLTYMVNYRDDTDPLNVKLGSSGLKNEKSYRLRFGGGHNDWDKKIMQTLYFVLTKKSDAIAMGYNYNTTTGVRTYKAYNVNGNWAANMEYEYSRPLDRQKKLSMSSRLVAEYGKSVDMIGSSSTGLAEPSKSSVGTFLLNENLTLDYKIGRNSTIGFKGDFAWRNIDGNQENFERINALNFNYGVLATITMPFHLQLSSDLTMYSRRGYKGSSMNTNDLLWNARLSYTMLRGKLTWMLDGFDILGKLNNITRTVNAQGRTEIFNNALPRYALLHVAYHFNVKPSKK